MSWKCQWAQGGGDASARASNHSQARDGQSGRGPARVQWGAAWLLWGWQCRAVADEAGGLCPGSSTPGAGRGTLLRVTEGAERLGMSPSLTFQSSWARLGVLSWGPGRGRRAVPALNHEGHVALGSLSICPNFILFNECPSDSLVLKFRALGCSTEVYECLKTALRSPK